MDVMSAVEWAEKTVETMVERSVSRKAVDWVAPLVVWLVAEWVE